MGRRPTGLINDMITQFGILLTFLAAGEFIVWLTGVNIPSSIIGMLLLTASLHFGIVKPRQIEHLCKFLVHNLGFFFVPAGVGLMNCFGLISDQLLPIVAASVGSTVIIIAVSGQVHSIVRKRLSHRQRAAHTPTEI